MSAAERFDGMHILIVEDEYYIAAGLEEFFAEAGASVLGPVSTVKAALALIGSHGDSMHGATLDVNLRGAHVFPVAEALRARKIPFVLSTGYDGDVIPPDYQDVVRLQKPVSPSAIAHRLAACIAAAK